MPHGTSVSVADTPCSWPLSLLCSLLACRFTRQRQPHACRLVSKALPKVRTQAARQSSRAMSRPNRGLKFCPETNDLLYPRENKDMRRLEYYCKNCDYVEEANPKDWCVYVSETTFSAADKAVVVHDVIADPTLPRTKDVHCPTCQHPEAVFISEATEKGMTLYFTCVSCKNRWKDYI